MNGKYLLDTNALINLLRASNYSFKIDGGFFFISIITEIEFLSYSKLTIEERASFSSLFKNEQIINIDSTIKSETITLKSNTKIKLPDAVICSTATVNGLILVRWQRIV